MQTLEWAGGLYLDFLGLSGEICFFPVLFYLRSVMCKLLPAPRPPPPSTPCCPGLSSNKSGAWNYCYTLMP